MTPDLPSIPATPDTADTSPQYSTASDGSRLVQLARATDVPKQGRRRTPTGDCHAVPAWAPAVTVCGRFTEGMALWPEFDFTEQRVQICRDCRVGVVAAQATVDARSAPQPAATAAM